MNDFSDLRKDIQYLFKAQEKMKCEMGSNIFHKYIIKGYLSQNHNKLYQAQDASGKQVAIKENHDIKQMQKEVQLLESLNHPNIVKYLESCILSYSIGKYQQGELGYICMELGQYNLDDFKNADFPIDSQLIDQTLSALAYLQKRNIAHCDIKPANILVMKLNPVCYKICDVGSSKHQNSELFDAVGTYKYMSPEMFLGNAKNYFLSDVFSLGLLFLYVFKNVSISYQYRCQLTPNEYIQMLHEKINQNDDDISILLKKMIQYNPNDRYDFIQLEKFWEDSKKNKFNKLTYLNQENPIRLKMDITFLKEESPLKQSPQKVGRSYKKQSPATKQSFYSQQLSNERQIYNSPFQFNQITERKITTSSRLRNHSLQKQYDYTSKPPKSPEKSKIPSPFKQSKNSKLQLPQLQAIKIRQIE